MSTQILDNFDYRGDKPNFARDVAESVNYVKRNPSNYYNGQLIFVQELNDYRRIKKYVDGTMPDVYHVTLENIVTMPDSIVVGIGDSTIKDNTDGLYFAYTTVNPNTNTIILEHVKLPAATSTTWGVMTPTDKQAIDNIDSTINTKVNTSINSFGFQQNNGKLVSYQTTLGESSSTVTKEVPVATQSSDGAMSKEDKLKLDNMQATSGISKVTQAEYTALQQAGNLSDSIIYCIVG